MRIRVVALVLASAAVLGLTACGASTAGSGSASRACPSPADPGMGTPTSCVLYDPDAAMRQNEAYRIATSLPPSATTAAAPDVARVRVALAPIAREPAPTEAELRTALLGLGFAPGAVQTERLAFGVEADGGCVAGGIGPDGLDVHFAGYIADGGCLALEGH